MEALKERGAGKEPSGADMLLALLARGDDGRRGRRRRGGRVIATPRRRAGRAGRPRPLQPAGRRGQEAAPALPEPGEARAPSSSAGIAAAATLMRGPARCESLASPAVTYPHRIASGGTAVPRSTVTITTLTARGLPRLLSPPRFL